MPKFKNDAEINRWLSHEIKCRKQQGLAYFEKYDWAYFDRRIMNGKFLKIITYAWMKFETIMKIRYGIIGDLASLIDSLWQNKRFHEIVDHSLRAELFEDNTPFEKKAAYFTDTMHKFRWFRNNFYHTSAIDVIFTANDLRSCISLILQLNYEYDGYSQPETSVEEK
ncbi:hypothetical protein [[Mycoplasma] testudinis]|uniref:hypothetical protein n=1 Tax=[Mycoplasma] testudinis TaxID=33924 RepID=UPI000484A9E5|nr:hypothetical protein [[Mycoplasma] testudinis]